MNVNSCTAGSILYENTVAVKDQSEQTVREQSENPTVIETNAVATDEPITNEIAEDSDNVKQKGVIRNLLNGHFKGVADVRLRINFSDELNAIEAEQANVAVRDSIAELSSNFGNEVNSVATNPEIGEENAALLNTSYSDFDSTINSAMERVEAGGISVGDAIAELKSAIGSFSESAISIAEPDPEGAPIVAEEMVEEAVVAEESAEEVVIEEEPVAGNVENTEAESSMDQVYNQLIQDLVTMFQDELARIEDEMNSYSALPPISEPSGNGKAFDKFMSIYNSLNSVEENQSEIIPETIEPEGGTAIEITADSVELSA